MALQSAACHNGRDRRAHCTARRGLVAGPLVLPFDRQSEMKRPPRRPFSFRHFGRSSRSPTVRLQRWQMLGVPSGVNRWLPTPRTRRLDCCRALRMGAPGADLRPLQPDRAAAVGALLGSSAEDRVDGSFDVGRAVLGRVQPTGRTGTSCNASPGKPPPDLRPRGSPPGQIIDDVVIELVGEGWFSASRRYRRRCQTRQERRQVGRETPSATVPTRSVVGRVNARIVHIGKVAAATTEVVGVEL